MDNQIIEKYLIAVHRLQEVERQRLTPKDFERVVQESGLTERELEFVRQECQHLATQGETYMRAFNYPRAAQLLAQAVALDPYHLPNLLLCTHAHLLAYQQTGDHHYADALLQFTQRGLEIAPSEIYFTTVETLLQQVAPLRRQMRSRIVLASTFSGLFLLSLVFLIAQTLNFDFSPIFVLTAAFTGLSFLLAAFFWLLTLIAYARVQQLRTRLARLEYKKKDPSQPLFPPMVEKIIDSIRSFFK